MIKKDINLDNFATRTKKVETTIPTNNVDAIFADADYKMAQNSLDINKYSKKAKRSNPIVRAIRNFLIFLIVLTLIVVGVAIYAFKQFIPQAKDVMMSQFQSARQELFELNDTELTTEEYYQKQLLLLITEEDVENAINDAFTVESFFEMLVNGGEIPFDVVPEDKREEYNRLIEEYKQAMAQESENEATEPTENTKDETKATDVVENAE